jgi:hypothetical protein
MTNQTTTGRTTATTAADRPKRYLVRDLNTERCYIQTDYGKYRLTEEEITPEQYDVLLAEIHAKRAEKGAQA